MFMKSGTYRYSWRSYLRSAPKMFLWSTSFESSEGGKIREPDFLPILWGRWIAKENIRSHPPRACRARPSHSADCLLNTSAKRCLGSAPRPAFHFLLSVSIHRLPLPWNSFLFKFWLKKKKKNMCRKHFSPNRSSVNPPSLVKHTHVFLFLHWNGHWTGLVPE